MRDGWQKIEEYCLAFSGKWLVFLMLFLVCIAWMIQLVFHQTWRCVIPEVSWHSGFIISLGLSCIPLLPVVFLVKNNDIPDILITTKDIFSLGILFLSGLTCWYLFSHAAAVYPVHLYGDESFHTSRVSLMAEDIHTWIGYFSGKIKTPPSYRAEYMMYPALAYVPVTLWTMIFGNSSQIADHRLFLFVQYISVVVGTFIFAKSVIKSYFVCFLLSLLPVTSALLISYTMSFYIELHYVGLLLIAAGVFSWGIQKKSRHIVIASVFLASLAPIIRESALPSAAGIIVSAMFWRYVYVNRQEKLTSLIASAGYFLAGFIPFIIYYLAKSNFTNFDKNRIFLSFVFRQDYLHLLQYSFLYLGPIFLIAAIYFLLHPLNFRKYPLLFLSAVSGILGSLFMQAVFVPGYMPWSRNYLSCYASFVMLTVLAIQIYMQNNPRKKNAMILLICVGVVLNCFFVSKYLYDDRFFHESEMVFDFSSIHKYLTSHKEINKIYIVWPKGYPTYPEQQLPASVRLVKIEPENIDGFPSFEMVRRALPKDTRYFIFYYMKNESIPSVFSHIPPVYRPLQLPEGYRILSEKTDPWSRRNNGVMLFKKG